MWGCTWAGAGCGCAALSQSEYHAPHHRHHCHHAPPLQVSPLLSSAAALVRHFPRYYADVVVSVARKTDAQLWPPLFSAVGPPSALLEGLLQAGALGSAACFLLVIDRCVGGGAGGRGPWAVRRASCWS